MIFGGGGGWLAAAGMMINSFQNMKAVDVYKAN